MSYYSPQYWLVELDQYGNAKLVDGAHKDRAGADKSFDLFQRFGFAKNRTLAVAEVRISEPMPNNDAGVEVFKK